MHASKERSILEVRCTLVPWRRLLPHQCSWLKRSTLQMILVREDGKCDYVWATASRKEHTVSVIPCYSSPHSRAILAQEKYLARSVHLYLVSICDATTSDESGTQLLAV